MGFNSGFKGLKKLSPGHFMHQTCYPVNHAVTRTLKRKYLQNGYDFCKNYNANISALKESHNRIISTVHSCLSGGYDTGQQIRRFGQSCCHHLQGVSTERPESKSPGPLKSQNTQFKSLKLELCSILTVIRRNMPRFIA